jgi:hypothetical protein
MEGINKLGRNTMSLPLEKSSSSLLTLPFVLYNQIQEKRQSEGPEKATRGGGEWESIKILF